MDKDKTPDEKAPLDAMGRAEERDDDTRTDAERELERVESIEAGADLEAPGTDSAITDKATKKDDKEAPVDDAVEVEVKNVKTIDPIKPNVQKKPTQDSPVKSSAKAAEEKDTSAVNNSKTTIIEKSTPVSKGDNKVFTEKIRAEISGKNLEPRKKGIVGRILAGLLIVLLGITAGWFAYQNMETGKQLTAIRNDLAASEQARLSAERRVQANQQGSKETKENLGTMYRTISEWGVRYMADAEDDDLTISLNIDRSGQEVLTLQSLSLARTRMSQNQAIASYPCATLIASAGSIARLSQEEYNKLTVDTANAEAAEWKAKAKKVGEHYYLAREPRSQCVPSGPEFANEQKKLEALTKKILELPSKFELVAQSQQTNKPNKQGNN